MCVCVSGGEVAPGLLTVSTLREPSDHMKLYRPRYTSYIICPMEMVTVRIAKLQSRCCFETHIAIGKKSFQYSGVEKANIKLSGSSGL